MATGTRLGEDFILQLDTDHNPALPSWETIKCVDGMTLNTTRNQVEMPCRGDARVGFKVAKPRITLSIEIYFSADDTNLKLIRDYALAGTILHFRIVDAPTGTPVAGDEYLQDQYYVSSQDLPLGMEDGAKYTMELVPATDFDDANITPGVWTAVS